MVSESCFVLGELISRVKVSLTLYWLQITILTVFIVPIYPHTALDVYEASISPSNSCVQ